MLATDDQLLICLLFRQHHTVVVQFQFAIIYQMNNNRNEEKFILVMLYCNVIFAWSTNLLVSRTTIKISTYCPTAGHFEIFLFHTEV